MQKGDKSPAKLDIEAPDGWEWTDEWQVDLNRAVDEYGPSILSSCLTSVSKLIAESLTTLTGPLNTVRSAGETSELGRGAVGKYVDMACGNPAGRLVGQAELTAVQPVRPDVQYVCRSYHSSPHRAEIAHRSDVGYTMYSWPVVGIISPFIWHGCTKAANAQCFCFNSFFNESCLKEDQVLIRFVKTIDMNKFCWQCLWFSRICETPQIIISQTMGLILLV